MASGERAFRRPTVGSRIFGLLAASAVILYFQQRALTVAAGQIMPELHLSQMQLGWLEWAFVASYGLLQSLAAVFGPRFGARWLLFWTGLIAVAAIVALPIAPSLLKGPGLYVALLAAQFLLGASQAPYFAVSAGVMEAWLPVRRWAAAQGGQTMAAQLGAAIAPLVVVLLMQALGWRQAVLWTVLPAVAVYVVWVWFVRDNPRSHPMVRPEELVNLEPSAGPHGATRLSLGAFVRLAGRRDIVLLSLSYLCLNYAFYLLANWCFLYLVQARGMSVLQSGRVAGLPPLGAALGAGAGGAVADWLLARFGARIGYRLLPFTALPLAGVLLITVEYCNLHWALAALFLCFFCIELTEGSYWATMMRVAGGETMAAAAVFNTGGNLGGMIGIPIVAYLSGRGAWSAAFSIGAATTFIAALAWLGVDPDRHRSAAKPNEKSPTPRQLVST